MFFINVLILVVSEIDYAIIIKVGLCYELLHCCLRQIATHVSHTAMAQEVSSNVVVQPPASANVESADESNHFQTAFLRRQVNQTMSVGRAISSIAGHYPQEIVSIVDIALDTYPDKYREIIFAAISAQPAFTEEVVQLAIEKEVSSCPNIVQLAIKAEPTYVTLLCRLLRFQHLKS